MTTSQSRLELFIDVFENKKQRALALPDITPVELIGAILHEFRELEYLAPDPSRYTLVNDSHEAADPAVPIGQQFAPSAHLRLVEPAMELPPGTKTPVQPLYLREIASGNVFPIPWLPAIIGRPDRSQDGNELVAVNLESFKTGLRVSRRHARISAAEEGLVIESLSRNPTRLRHDNGDETEVSQEQVALRHGDVIYLERSNIALKVILRD